MEGRERLLHDFYKTKAKTWVLLRGFCDPAMIKSAGGDTWALPGKHDLVNSSTRITNILARGHSFVAYSPDAHASDHGAVPAEARGGIVLIGSSDAAPDTAPTVLPWFQGTGIVKVEQGESHWGALDKHGRLKTWGDWNYGARGTWDAYPPSITGRGPALPTEALIGRLAAGYRRVRLRLREVAAAVKSGRHKSPLNKTQKAALKERCKFREPPRQEEEPKQVSFLEFDGEADSKERVVLDFAMAGELLV